jgi:hypothetical protein
VFTGVTNSAMEEVLPEFFVSVSPVMKSATFVTSAYFENRF